MSDPKPPPTTVEEKLVLCREMLAKVHAYLRRATEIWEDGTKIWPSGSARRLPLLETIQKTIDLTGPADVPPPSD